jgi:hypothetical protein
MNAGAPVARSRRLFARRAVRSRLLLIGIAPIFLFVGAVMLTRSSAPTGRPPSPTVPPRNSTGGPVDSTPSTTLRNCAVSPHSCGYPDASNTGVPAGANLLRVPAQRTSGPGWHWDTRGWLEVDGAGAVVSNVSVNGTIDVAGAPGAVIKQSLVDCEGCDFAIIVRDPQGTSRPSSDNVTIEDTTITAETNNSIGVDIMDVKNTTLVRLNISHTGGGVQTSTDGGWSIRGSYVHDLTQVSDEHMNGIQSSGGGNLQIRHNTIFNRYPFTDAVMLAVDPHGSKQQNVLVQDNLMAGGGYTIYGGSTGSGCTVPCSTSDIRIVDNRFSRLYFPSSGYYGPVAAYNSEDPGNQLSGNVWDDTGLTLDR